MSASAVTPDIDLSAGLVQSPPPSDGGIDLSAGLVDGGQSDQAPDTQPPAPPESMLSTAANAVGNLWPNLITGAGHGLAKTAMGISSLTGAPVIPQAQTAAAEPNANLEQSAGEMYENILEFMMGDEALKGLSLGDKLTKIGPVLKMAEKFPNVAKALSGAARVGTVSAGQAAVKGGSPSDIAEQGLIGAATGGLVEGGAGKLTDAIAERSPQVSNVAGENIVTPKPAQVSPEVQQAQAAGQRVITGAAKNVARENVGLVNDRPSVAMEGTVQGEPTGSRTIPKPPIVDVPAAVARVQSFGDAADEVEKAAKRSYDVIDATTNGKFNAIKDDFAQAQKDVWTAIGPEERDAAQGRLDNATAAMRQLFEETDGKVTQQDWEDANSAWNNAKTLRQVHNAVESTFDTDAGFSQRSGTYRGFNGNQLRANLNRLTQKIGEPELNRVIGRDNMDNLRKVAELTRTNSDRAKFGAAVQKVGGWLARDASAAGVGALLGHATGLGGFGGAVAGEAGYMAARKVMQMVATNPRIGQQLTFAVESGARPEYYAPLIGKMIRDAEEEGKIQ